MPIDPERRAWRALRDVVLVGRRGEQIADSGALPAPRDGVGARGSCLPSTALSGQCPDK